MLRFTNTKNLQLLIHVSIILLTRKIIKLIETICVLLLSYLLPKKKKTKKKLCETIFRTFEIPYVIPYLLILSLNWKSISLKHFITLFVLFFSRLLLFTSISMNLSLQHLSCTLFVFKHLIAMALSTINRTFTYSHAMRSILPIKKIINKQSEPLKSVCMNDGAFDRYHTIKPLLFEFG